MRIAIEALALIPGITGGIETYVRALVSEMLRLEPDNDYLIAVGREAHQQFHALSPKLEEFNADLGNAGLLRSHRYLQTLSQCWQLHKKLRYWRHDVLHCTMSFPKPPWGAPRMVTTIHDIGVIDIHHMWKEAGPRLAELLIRIAVRKASAIITISEFAAERISNRLGVPSHKLHVVYNGIDHTTFQSRKKENSETTKSCVPQKYGIASDFLLYPAHTHLHKNHLKLLAAMRILQESYRLSPLLVLTGSPSHAHSTVLHAVCELGLQSNVKWLGHVPVKDLAALYQSAIALVFPSLYEGFGLPIIEAMACGCPVACSNTTATAEIAGDAALTFDPTNAGAIAESIARILTDTALRQELVDKGLVRARQFSWENTARQTLAVYRKVLDMAC